MIRNKNMATELQEDERIDVSAAEAARLGRIATAIKWLSTLVIVGALLAIVRSLPLEHATAAMDGWISGLGIWGPVVFALIYVVATVLFVPGLILTMAAGAIFGLWIGTITVSVGSTIGSVIAFSLSRYLMRDKVAKVAQRNPRFDAIDQAIDEGGWKIVALLRLSPAIPFNLQNYLYGLTRIRFWPYMITSWLAMLPGTFLYVYIGHVAGLAVGGQRARTPGEWLLLGVGLLSTIVVTVYVTRLARSKLRQQMKVADGDGTKPTPADQHAAEQGAKPRLRGALLTATVAVALTAAAGYLRANPGQVEHWLVGFFGPPQVNLAETYSEKPGGPRFDHSTFEVLLKKHVDGDGWVDYAGLKADSEALDEYISDLQKAPFDELGRSEKLALLINAYNAFTLKLIIEHMPLASILDIPAAQRWDDARWNVGGHIWSLNQIEQVQIRGHFKEPRIHFALVCGAVGCPPIRHESYSADLLEQQLADQAAYVHNHATWFQFKPDARVVRLTRLYSWYGGDFRQVAGSVLLFASRYSVNLKQAVEAGNKPRIDWLPYDWRLNDQDNKATR